MEGKYFYSIADVSKELNLPHHVLRFWEEKFPKVSPHKSKGRRYYREDDVKLLKQIKYLLYEQGYTIKGVQKYLEESKIDNPPSSQPIVVKDDIKPTSSDQDRSKAEILLKKLYQLREKIQKYYEDK